MWGKKTPEKAAEKGRVCPGCGLTLCDPTILLCPRCRAELPGGCGGCADCGKCGKGGPSAPPS